jgi:hypothetical protein
LSKSPIESAIEETQRCLKAAPVIVLGSGASAPYGLPTMRTLGQHLVDSIDAGGFTPAEQELWTEFKTALATKDLESALHAVKLSEPLSKSVICKTWALISKADTDAFHRLITNANLLAITRLYRYLFDCVHRTISVVTTNYDRLAEYGADAAGVCHYTGFTYGYLRDRQPANRVSFLQDRKPARTVEIWKVHGSIDWFADATDQVIGLPPMPSLPGGMTPAIVTPGIEKFERTHARRTLSVNPCRCR